MTSWFRLIFNLRRNNPFQRDATPRGTGFLQFEGPGLYRDTLREVLQSQKVGLLIARFAKSRQVVQ